MSYNPPKLSEHPDWVEVAIDCCGICGSDIHTIDAGWGPTNFPVIVGHEIIGRVSAAGPKVTNVKVGDRVGIGAQCGSCHNANGDCEECGSGNENHCRRTHVWTYNSKYPDGQVSQGGYADRIRCDAKFAFHIPENISSQEAAPLMCAGATVYSPLVRSLTRPNMRVGIIGIGGLGHLAVMFASKLQNGSCEVTAISHNSKKKEAALSMGATKFLDTSDEEAVKQHFRYFDYVLTTANGSDMDVSKWMSMVRLGGGCCTVGIPEAPFRIAAFSLLGARINFTASSIGSIAEIESMLKFCSEHNVRPIIERMPMEKANEGIAKVRDGSVRFRVVLENNTNKA